MGIIAFFLITIYTYLVFKKRKRLQEMKEQEAKQEEITLKLDQRTASSEHLGEQNSLLRSFTGKPVK